MVFVDMICMPFVDQLVEAIILYPPPAVAQRDQRSCSRHFPWYVGSPYPLGGRLFLFTRHLPADPRSLYGSDHSHRSSQLLPGVESFYVPALVVCFAGLEMAGHLTVEQTPRINQQITSLVLKHRQEMLAPLTEHPAELTIQVKTVTYNCVECPRIARQQTSKQPNRTSCLSLSGQLLLHVEKDVTAFMKKHRQNIAMVVLGCLFSFNLDGPPQAPGARAKVTGGTLVAVKDDRPDIPYKRLNTLVASPVRIVLMESNPAATRPMVRALGTCPPNHPRQ
jgi:hypothetical protein